MRGEREGDRARFSLKLYREALHQSGVLDISLMWIWITLMWVFKLQFHFDLLINHHIA